MQLKIDVSVIIPVFNAQTSIGHLVHVLLSEQTLSIEVIVVDDGSTDETSTILNAITDERLILVHQENQGVYAARNTALAVHGGEWVVFLDADDRIEGKRTARAVLTGMCYSVGSATRQGSSSFTRLTGQSAMTSST
ncbi:glycosyltransferase [Citrobacter freundii]|nr:glycosyltransferase [Citrobacter freundii]